MRYRHVSKYILDGSDRTVPKATGLDVIDLSTSKRIRHGLDFNFAIDNVNNKRFYETQNYLESRVTPAANAKISVPMERRGIPSDLLLALPSGCSRNEGFEKYHSQYQNGTALHHLCVAT